MRKVAAVIVNLNAGRLLGECLGSLFDESKGLELGVEIVDNGSTDGSAEAAAREFPGIRLTRAGRNLGFAAAANIALRRIRDEGNVKYVLLLNPDTVIEDRAIVRLAEYLDAHPEVGAVGPALLLPDGRFQTGAGGFLPAAWTGFVYFFFLFKLLPGKVGSFFIDQAAFVRRARAAEVEWLSGACLMVKRDVLDRAGLLDESYFFYGEDVAWGKAMGDAGFKLRYYPGARIVHHHGFYLKESSSGANTLWLEMIYRFIRRERGRGEYLLFRLFSAGGFFLRWAGYSLAGQGRSGIAARRGARDASGFLSFALFGPLLHDAAERKEDRLTAAADMSGLALPTQTTRVAGSEVSGRRSCLSVPAHARIIKAGTRVLRRRDVWPREGVKNRTWKRGRQSVFVNPRHKKESQFSAETETVGACLVCGSGRSKFYVRKFGLDLVRCLDCGLVFANPRLSEDALLERYESPLFFDDYLKNLRAAPAGYDPDFVRRHYHLFLGLIGRYFAPGKTLLDVGCGAGFFVKAAAEAGWKAEGVEISRLAAEYARRVVQAEVWNGRLEEAGFPEGGRDLITMLDLLEHLPNPLRTLGEARRILKSGGILVVSTPDLRSLSRRILGRNWAALSPGEHLANYDAGTLGSILRRAEFDVIAVKNLLILNPEYTHDKTRKAYGAFKKVHEALEKTTFMDHLHGFEYLDLVYAGDEKTPHLAGLSVAKRLSRRIYLKSKSLLRGDILVAIGRKPS